MPVLVRLVRLRPCGRASANAVVERIHAALALALVLHPYGRCSGYGAAVFAARLSCAHSLDTSILGVHAEILSRTLGLSSIFAARGRRLRLPCALLI